MENSLHERTPQSVVLRAIEHLSLYYDDDATMQAISILIRSLPSQSDPVCEHGVNQDYAECSACYDERHDRLPRRLGKLTRTEFEEGLADHGVDTLEEWNLEV
jgi:hypothetical protein